MGDTLNDLVNVGAGMRQVGNIHSIHLSEVYRNLSKKKLEGVHVKIRCAHESPTPTPRCPEITW